MCCVIAHIHTRQYQYRAYDEPGSYLFPKRKVKICVGDKPAISSILVNTNVLPQTATTINAIIWYIMSSE
ncbi:MAG: hypothetical protein II546_01135 [Prevotella sp.]|nr:hypothetical protein [Prevotella sp.]